jgi:hypothetical protein
MAAGRLQQEPGQARHPTAVPGPAVDRGEGAPAPALGRRHDPATGRPGAPAARPVVRAAGPVLRGSRRALTCLLITAALIVAVPPQHAAVPVIVSYRHDLAKLTRLARYTVVAPDGLPRSWYPVSSGLAIGGANGPGTATWHLGFWTPSGRLASLEETDASPGEFVRRMTNDGTLERPVRVAGRVWDTRWNADRRQRSMYYTSRAGVTVVVTGDATWAELRVLAASLRPQTR